MESEEPFGDDMPNCDVFGTVFKELLGTFRFEYEYEIEYEKDFSILICRLHIITTQTHLIPWASLST